VGGQSAAGGSGGGAPAGGSANGTGGAPASDNPIAGTASYDCSESSGQVPELSLTQIPGQLTAPVDLAHPPNDNRLFVITLGGDVRVFKDGQLLPTPALSLGNRVAVGGAPGDERGLLGIAFHPDFAQNGLFYLHHSAGQGIQGAATSDTVIVEYKMSADNPDVADPASARIVLTVAQPNNGGGFNNHKGGAINFGPNKLLFIGLGDGGGSGDQHQPPNGQSTTSLLGKILRINPLASGSDAYTNPPDNLIADVPAAAPEIWDYGLRNPFRSSFDACTGDLYIGDVGQNQWEEIDVEKAGEGHKNYGWNRMEGLHCFNPQMQDTSPADCDKSGITLPQIEVADEEGTSITGGSVYRGASIPALRGVYFYADYAQNKVWWTRYDRTAGTVSTSTSVTQQLNPRQIVAIRNGNDGELYFVSLGAITGSTLGPGGLYKLEAAE
jgi:glucose/arabinose dehydrogenase